MSKSFIPALVAAFGLALASIPASVSAGEARGSISPASAKAMKLVDDAARAKQWGEVISNARKVLAISGRTPFDTYAAYGFMASAYQAQGNRTELATALQGQLDSGHPLSPVEQNRIIKSLAGLSFEQKNYAQAVEYSHRLIRNGAADADTYDLVAHGFAQQGKAAEAIKFLKDHVADAERRGQVPRERTLLALRDLQDRHGDKEGAIVTLEKLVRHYPKADYWNLLTYQMSKGPKLSDRQSLQIYRLKMATGTLKRCQDFSEMEELADAAGMPGEAQKVIEQALATKVCSADKASEGRLVRHLTSISNVVAEDKAKFPKLEADAMGAKTGELDVAVGSQLFGYGEYAKAAEALARGIAKGGLKNPEDVQLTLATAQYRADNKAEALKTLRSIKTPDQTVQRLVKLWILYVE